MAREMARLENCYRGSKMRKIILGLLLTAFSLVTNAQVQSGQYNASGISLIDGQAARLQLDSSGNLKVTGGSGGGSSSNAAAGTTGSTVPTSGDYIAFNVSGSLTGVSSSNPLPVTQATTTYTITQTIVSVSTTSVQLIAANASRKYLGWQVNGTGTLTCAPGSSAAVAGAGFMFTGAGTGLQGSAQEFPHGAPTSQFQCIASSGTISVNVWEGN